MSDTPDLDRAREAARGIFHAAYYGRALPDTVVRLILEQRAEEAERFNYLSRAADLRRQARAALSNSETDAAREAKKK